MPLIRSTGIPSTDRQTPPGGRCSIWRGLQDVKFDIAHPRTISHDGHEPGLPHQGLFREERQTKTSGPSRAPPRLATAPHGVVKVDIGKNDKFEFHYAMTPMESLFTAPTRYNSFILFRTPLASLSKAIFERNFYRWNRNLTALALRILQGANREMAKSRKTLFGHPPLDILLEKGRIDLSAPVFGVDSSKCAPQIDNHR